ncbi:protein white-like isoform X2 [Scylla paramamosain]|uniref:protein white-like isoform X2 n=1 Tax=Scylla paramamosain TaxID=85552 RepID=UPI003083EC3C
MAQPVLSSVKRTTSIADDNHWLETGQRASSKKMESFPPPSSVTLTSLPTEEEAHPITFSWQGVDVFTKPLGVTGWRCFSRRGVEVAPPPAEVHILKNVTGVCRPGELLAIMGASGAGKTTLLNVLTHRNSEKLRITGDLFVNGRRVDPDTLTSRSAYVQQDDLFIGYLTVREQLIFQAALRMDRHRIHEERQARVNQVIMDLGLNGSEHTRIGTPGQDRRLSGGEIKRLSFACEVLTNPSLLFCDEPTSGLDSFMAQNVVSMMKGMAERGKTVLSTIHQPSSEVFAMFDRVLFLAEGRVAFLGSCDEALRFFGKMGMACPDQYNPADHFINQLSVEPGSTKACKKRIHSVCDAFELSNLGKAVVEDVAANQRVLNYQDDVFSCRQEGKSPYRSTWGTQFQWVMWRSWLETIREPRLIRIRCLQVLALAVLLGLMYMRKGPYVDVVSINGAFFVLVCNMSFQNTTIVINTFCSQKKLFLREHHNGMYRPDVYFLSKNIVQAPIFTLYAILYTSIFYFLVGFTPDVDRFLTCLVTAVLLTWCAMSFGYFLSCVAPSVDVALLLLSPFLLLFMLVSGFFLNFRSIPRFMKVVSYLSWFAYGNEVLLVNQWASVTNITCPPTATRCYPDGAAILEQLGLSPEHLVPDLTSLACLTLAYRVAAYLFFHLRTLRSKPRR